MMKKYSQPTIPVLAEIERGNERSTLFKTCISGKFQVDEKVQPSAKGWHTNETDKTN
jgi:hypothetical protein